MVCVSVCVCWEGGGVELWRPIAALSQPLLLKKDLKVADKATTTLLCCLADKVLDFSSLLGQQGLRTGFIVHQHPAQLYYRVGLQGSI